MFWQIFAVGTIGSDTSASPQILEFVAFKLGESPFLGNEDLLTSGKLEFGPPESFNNGSLMSVVCSDGHEGLSNAYTSHSTLGLAEGTSHSSLQTISACTGQHFVDPQNMVGMNTDSDVELILGCVFHHVLVTANTGGLKSFSRQLLKFIRHKMDTQREFINSSLFAAQIENSDLGIGDTTTETRLGVRFVLTITITSCGTTTHLV